MSVLLQSFSFCSLIVATTSTRLYFVNDSYGVPPNNLNNIFFFDTNTKKSTIFDQMKEATVTIIDPATTCYDMYYAYEGSPNGSPKIGFIAFDPNNTNQVNTYSTTNQYPSFDSEVVACSNSTHLLMLNSIETKNFESYYELTLAHFDDSNGNKLVMELIGYLPNEYAYDYGSNIFQFNADATELWVAAVDQKVISKSVLLIIDTQTANIKQTYSFPSTAGTVYFTLPQTLDNGSFKAAIVPPSNYGVDFVTVKIEENSKELSVKTEIKDANLYGDDMPSLAVCDGVGYIITERTGTVVEFDINTGKQMNEYNVATNGHYLEMGSIAC